MSAAGSATPTTQKRSDRPSPSRADVDVVDLAGHHGKFCHHLDHVAAVQHHVALTETQLDLEWLLCTSRQSWLLCVTVPSACCPHWACAQQASRR